MADNGLYIGDHCIQPGEKKKLELPVAKLYSDTDIRIPVYVVRSKKPGPTVFISAAIHGDELNGIEIVRRLIQQKSLRLLSGSLILVPIINIYGVHTLSRYMPDRRDLNRCFPGSEKGSLAARVADIFTEQIVKKCQYGIDLHTGAIHRSNLPQIRANLNDSETAAMAEAFGVPVLINANIRDGSLRQSAAEAGAKVLLYEAGQALRFDELSIRAGVRGVLNVLSYLGMLKPKKSKQAVTPFTANNSAWVRASASGIISNKTKIGDNVTKGQLLAKIGDPFGDEIAVVNSPRAGIVIGMQNIPLVQEGDAMYHIAFFSEDDEAIAEHIENLHETLLPESPPLGAPLL